MVYGGFLRVHIFCVYTKNIKLVRMVLTFPHTVHFIGTPFFVHRKPYNIIYLPNVHYCYAMHIGLPVATFHFEFCSQSFFMSEIDHTYTTMSTSNSVKKVWVRMLSIIYHYLYIIRA